MKESQRQYYKVGEIVIIQSFDYYTLHLWGQETTIIEALAPWDAEHIDDAAPSENWAYKTDTTRPIGPDDPIYLDKGLLWNDQGNRTLCTNFDQI